MKKGLKFWSKLLIASFFLGGMATSAMAQSQDSWDDRGWTTTNTDDVTARTQCGGRVLKVTRTQQQMLDGTEITLKFNNDVVGDAFYLVAEQGGSLAGVTGNGCPVAPNVVYGGNLAVGTITDNVFTPTSSRPTTGTAIVSAGNTIAVKAINVADNDVENVASTYYLGVYIQDETTSCYSDVYYVEIQVLKPIYASIILNGDNPYEYICNGAKTNTNIGINLCNLPGNGKFSYTATLVNDTDTTGLITGSKVYAALVSGELDHEGRGQGSYTDGQFVPSSGGTQSLDGAGLVEDLVITGIVPDANNKYDVRIGRQTLTNNSKAFAGTAEYTFTNMTYTYTGQDANGDPIEITLPVIFESADGYCDGNGAPGTAYPTTFKVFVAPALETRALAFAKDNERPNPYTPGTTLTAQDTTAEMPTFCQGTLAYLFAETSANDSVDADGNNLFGTTTYAWEKTIGTALTFNPNANIQAPTTSELTSTAGYTLHLVATWNDADNNYGTTGCTAEDDINITVTPAPILLVATDETALGDDTWNSTNVITAPEVCPSNSIYINTLNNGDPVTDGTDRDEDIMAGNYIRHYANDIVWTAQSTDGVVAYSTWRSGDPQTAGTIDDEHVAPNTNVTHYLDNPTTANPAHITYTVKSAGSCALVKSNGMPLNNGEVQIVYPVSSRPTFSLGN